MNQKLSSKDKSHISANLDFIEKESQKSIKLGYSIKKFILIILMLIFGYNTVGSAFNKEIGFAFAFSLITVILFLLYLETLKNEIIEKINKNL